MMKPVLRKCEVSGLADLQALSRKTFDETFRHMNTPETMATYLDTAFNINKLREELNNPASAFYFLEDDGRLAGYLKLNDAAAQTDINDPASLEIERIYISGEYQSQGLGSVLMEHALAIARQNEKTSVWLGVWEKNEKAINFYKKHGFTVSGTHVFIMGDEVQTDFVMRKNLAD